MRVNECDTVAGLKTITPYVFRDYRGYFVETWNDEEWRNDHSSSIFRSFVQDDISFSKKGVLRGLHGDWKTWKLLWCVHGLVFAAFVDCRKYSRTFGAKLVMYLGMEFHDDRSCQVMVPQGVAAGIYALYDSVLCYKQTTYYQGQEAQFTLAWNDPELNIPWPLEGSPVISERDMNGSPLASFREISQGEEVEC